ncbi:DUF5789 family protein [Halobacterium litoreum]|uniref:Halobacterial output domain-containing protein n=1 Tax=Halobacterium litoreum TaxID=2039234 RepID=A0ABD5NGU7_9EURY|nr:hypothetical protein [Halobacterium litoreum]UHH12617.1 hypothetical protein LT972_10660 [Halobacterium litoreum]
MTREVKLNELAAELDALSYPATHADASTELSDVVLLYADGEERFVDVLDRSNEDVFVSRDDLESEVFSLLPTEAVGEPGQSEGEG